MLDRGRARIRYRQSLIVLPSLYVAAACLAGVIAPQIDKSRHSGTTLDASVGTARDILTATATGMIAFTGFVVSGVLVVVQFAAGQYSPRLVLWFRRDVLTKHAIGIFLAAFVYALVALRRLEESRTPFSPDVTVGVALLLIVGSCVLFLALLQRVTDRLRPRTLYGAVVRAGIDAARETYPAAVGEAEPPDRSAWASDEPLRVRLTARPGVVTSFDRAALGAAADRAGAVIEVVTAVGEYAGPGAELLHVHGGTGIDGHDLARHVVVADERTIEQDPAFAMRMVVDTAIRALSPAVNDPTTAVQALDVLEVLVRELAGRELDAPLVRDAGGHVRVLWRSPGWSDFLDLAFDEIREYGAGALQVSRRMRAVLEDLRATTPERRHAELDAHLARLDTAVFNAFPAGSPGRETAMLADRTGLGLARH